MKITVDNFTIETDAYGYKLTETKATNHIKSKTGVTSQVTFHATLGQVAAKMMYLTMDSSAASEVRELSEVVTQASNKIENALESLK